MKFLLVGHGAREHAIARRLVHDGHEVVACAMQRNPGLVETCSSFVKIDNYAQAQEIVHAARVAKVAMILPCDERSLFAGVADFSAAEAIPCLGHRMEASILLERRRNTVIAAMKGNSPVRPPKGIEVARSKELRDASELGDKVVIKPLYPNKTGEYAIVFGSRNGRFRTSLFPAWVETDEPGWDFSLHYLVSGERFYFLGVTLDYPMLNQSSRIVTGGMGAIALPENFNTPIAETLMQKCREMTENGMRRLYAEYQAGFCGFVSAQFRKTRRGVVFAELDCKPGNPEFPALLPQIQGDIGALFHAVFHGAAHAVRKSRIFSVAVSLAPTDYPGKGNTRREFPPEAVSLAGGATFVGGVVTDVDGNLWADGSRTLCIVASATDLAAAVSGSLGHASEIAAISGLVFRQDIGSNLTANTATARVKKSLEKLKDKGGKRLMLRLSPAALAATREIMAHEGHKTETAAINETLIRRAKDLAECEIGDILADERPTPPR